MTFILDIGPGATYADYARHLANIAAKWSGVQIKPEIEERIEIHDGGDLIGEWRLESGISEKRRAASMARKTFAAGNGRPRTAAERCPCGQMTAKCAKARAHHC